MTKKNKVIFRLLGVFVVLLLVSICLLGSTFARYTSSGSGTGTVYIAEWNITESTLSGSSTITFGTSGTSGLSPNKDSYTGTVGSITAGTSGNNGNGYRYHATASTTIATITNASEVTADVTLTGLTNESHPEKITINSTTYTLVTSASADGEVTKGNRINETTALNSITETYTWETVANIFTVYVTATVTNGTDNGTSYTLNASNGEVVINAYVVWLTDDSLDETAADALDTFIGKYVESISWNIGWTAVQSSETP